MVIIVRNNDLENVKEFIKKGLNSDVYDARGNTLLMDAIEEGNVDIVKELIKAPLLCLQLSLIVRYGERAS